MASLGAPLDADYEIGSVSKGITGLLYADACTRGELGPDTTLGDVLPLGDCPAAGLTLAAVSRHTSGLPGLPRSARPWRRTAAFLLHGTNPYGETLEELLAQARTVQLSAPRPRYSNFGFELLGHAVAAGAGMSYRALVRERLAAPLGLTSIYMPATAEELGPRAIIGTSRSGRPRQPWTGEALAPAGGIRSSIGDMARIVQALLDGYCPGAGRPRSRGEFRRTRGAHRCRLDDAPREGPRHHLAQRRNGRLPHLGGPGPGGGDRRRPSVRDSGDGGPAGVQDAQGADGTGHMTETSVRWPDRGPRRARRGPAGGGP